MGGAGAHAACSQLLGESGLYLFLVPPRAPLLGLSPRSRPGCLSFPASCDRQRPVLWVQARTHSGGPAQGSALPLAPLKKLLGPQLLPFT